MPPSAALTNEQIKAAIEGAFAPHRCVAVIWDYDHRIKFKVIGADERELFEQRELVLDDIRSQDSLDAFLGEARRIVADRTKRPP